MFRFLGACDRFRKTENGEDLWQEMMNTRKEITESEFLKICDISKVLDEDELWEDYKETAKRQNEPIHFYKASNGLCFFQTTGFEFIWSDIV